MLTLLDTFAGIGGFSYAAERLLGGITTQQFVEINPFCQRVLRRHWPEVPIHDDIRSFTAAAGAFDIITGGFPCQDISNAGRGAGLSGERSGLWWELLRVIRMVGPRYVVLENVAAITGRGLGDVLGSLAAAGYDVEWACVRASDLGACHRRDRWWAVAHRCGQHLQGCGPQGQPLFAASGEEGGALWRHQRGCTLSPDWSTYASEPLLLRGDDGLSNRIHRLKALGNAVVPQVAAIPLGRVLDLEQLREE